MRRITWLLTLSVFAGVAGAQATAPATPADPTAAIAVLRNDLIDSFNKGDLPRLLSHLDDDAVITWQNGEVCHGPAELKSYYDKMMTGPDRRVQSAQAEPKVTGRQVYGDWAVTWGEMNDHFVLSPASRFTATTVRRGDVWKVAAFHVSMNAFDNPILSYAVKRTVGFTAAVAGVVGLVIGLIAGRMSRKTKQA
jgi:ketosteroid isomerase-like protein